MQIQKNSRQIPDNKMYTANKKYNDLLYSYLQEKSFKDVDGRRYIAKEDVVLSKIAKTLQKDRKTISKYFNNLIEMGLIQLNGDYYELLLLDRSISTLVPFETLQIINDTLKPKCISIYVYLLNRFLANQEQGFVVTMSQLKNFVGLSTATRSNDSTINNILLVLQKLGLIKMNLVQIEEQKTNIYIEWVTNKLEL